MHLTFYEQDVPNYKNLDKQLTLEIGENDGLVTIGIAPPGEATANLKCAIEPEEAEKVIRALSDALDRIGKKA